MFRKWFKLLPILEHKGLDCYRSRGRHDWLRVVRRCLPRPFLLFLFIFPQLFLQVLLFFQHDLKSVPLLVDWHEVASGPLAACAVANADVHLLLGLAFTYRLFGVLVPVFRLWVLVVQPRQLVVLDHVRVKQLVIDHFLEHFIELCVLELLLLSLLFLRFRHRLLQVIFEIQLLLRLFVFFIQSLAGGLEVILRAVQWILASQQRRLDREAFFVALALFEVLGVPAESFVCHCVRCAVKVVLADVCFCVLVLFEKLG